MLAAEQVGGMTWIARDSVLAMLHAMPPKGTLPETQRAAARRTFLKSSLGYGLLACVIDRRILQPLETGLISALRDEPRDNLRRLLGFSPTVPLSVSCGPVLRNLCDFHPDNRAGGSAILAALLPPNERLAPLSFTPRKGLRLEEAGSLLVAGGPVGCLYTRVAFEFEGASPKRLARRGKPIVPLRWYGLANELDPRVKALGRVAYTLEGVGQVFPNNWPLVDTESSRMWEVRTGRSVSMPGARSAYELQDNYLTVTRIPNFLSPTATRLLNANADPSAWPQLVALDGRNSIGTRGAELLTQADGVSALTNALQAIKRFGSSYQLLFRLTSMQSAQGFSRFSRIEFVAAHEIRLTSTALASAHRYAVRRLNAEGASRDDA